MEKDLSACQAAQGNPREEKMARRKSIQVAGFGHANPIPAACRIGNLLVSGGIHGIDPATGKVAEGLEDQLRLMFQHVRTIMAAGGGGTDDIIKFSVVMKDRARRPALNVEWLKMFPDEHSRPARHTSEGNLGPGMLVQCDIMAVIDGP
jgi:2-iminobutanoate/2-iminopropanoate deaminase